MPYVDSARRSLSSRGSVRTYRHGNWRQTYVDCLGMCVARVNGDELPCGSVDFLELHEMWGENGDPSRSKFQQRMLLCCTHHSLLEDRCHQTEFILWRPKPSRLTEDVALEILLAGGYQKWLEKWKLDDSRTACTLLVGPCVEDYE